MEKETEALSPQQFIERKNYLVWILAALALITIAWFMHTGLKIPDIGDPQSTNDLTVMVEDLKRLDQVYGETIESKSDFRDLWSLIAVLLAAVSAGAVILRAPQPIIITLGVFLAVIYGSMEIKKPQESIAAISKARNALSCTGNIVTQLMSIQGSENKASNLASELEVAFDLLNKNSIQLSVQQDRLSYVLTSQVDLRKSAVTKIDETLLTPTLSFDDEIQQLDDLIFELTDLIDSTDGATDDPQIKTGLGELKQLNSLLLRARYRLEQLGLIRERLNETISSYDIALSNAMILKQKASDQTLELNKIIPELKSNVPALRQFPGKLEAATLQANRALHQIHLNLLSNIAESGITIAQLKEIVDRPGEKRASKKRAAKRRMGARGDDEDWDELTEMDEEGSLVVEIPDPEILLARFDELNKATKALLNELEQTLADADAVIDSIQIALPFASLLAQAAISFADTGELLQYTVDDTEYVLSDAKSDINQANEIINQIDLDLTKSALENCVLLGPSISDV